MGRPARAALVVGACVAALCGTVTPFAAAAVPGGAYLSGVACPSATSCIAVGTAGRVPLVERWNGSAWTTLDVPTIAGAVASILNAVSCPSPKSCIAVGTATTRTASHVLLEHWDGRRWTIKPSPDPGSSPWRFGGVSCATSDMCVAVGTAQFSGHFHPFALRWNGSRWALMGVRPTNFSQLQGVSCPSPTSCVAVGLQNFDRGEQPLILRWNGSGWSKMSSPGPGDGRGANLSDVACTSPTRCIAVGGIFGERGHGFVLSSSGTKWSIAPTAPGNSEYIAGVSCPQPSSCFAAGLVPGTHSRTFVARWSASTWSVTPTPSVANAQSAFTDVACASTTRCAAVGYWSIKQGQETHPLTARWDGASWSRS
jgi:hypothetical protein